MSSKFVVEGGLKIGSGQNFELSGVDVDRISNSTTLVGDSQTALVTEYAVKTYVDNSLGTTDLNIAATANSGNLTGDDLKIDLSGGETLSILGTTNEIETDTDSANQITIGLPSAVEITTSMKAGTLSVSGGSITDTSGTIDFGDENLTIGGTIDVGANTSGFDVQFYGAGTGKYMLWDASDNKLVLDAALEMDDTITQGANTNGYDATFYGSGDGKKLLWDAANNTLDLDGALDVSDASQFGGTVTVGEDGTGFNVTMYSNTAGNSLAWNGTSLTLAGDSDLSVSGSSTFSDTITVGADDTGHDVKFYGATSGKAMLWDESADTLDIDGALNVSDASTFQNTVTMLSGSQLSSGSASAVSANADIANKAYVDSVVGSADLDVTVGGTDYDLDLDSEKIGFAGTSNEIEVAFAEANSVGTLTIGLPDDVTIGQDLSVTRNITVTGTSTMNGDVTLGDATGDSINFSGRQSTNLVPSADSTFDLGSSTLLYANIYADNLVGNATEMLISADGTEDDPSNSTANSLSLNASGGIFTDDAVDMDSTLNVEGIVTMQAGYETDYLKKDEFSVAMTGSAATCFTFDDSTYSSAKVVAKVNNGTNITSKEILIVSNGTDVSIVEYGTVSVGTEIAQTWAGSSASGTCTITCDAAAGTMVGSFELIK